MCLPSAPKMGDQEKPIIPILSNSLRDGKQAMTRGYSALMIPKPNTSNGVSSQTSGLTIKP